MSTKAKSIIEERQDRLRALILAGMNLDNPEVTAVFRSAHAALKRGVEVIALHDYTCMVLRRYSAARIIDLSTDQCRVVADEIERFGRLERD